MTSRGLFCISAVSFCLGTVLEGRINDFVPIGLGIIGSIFLTIGFFVYFREKQAEKNV